MNALSQKPEFFGDSKGEAIRVMIVDDSLVARSVLERILEQHQQIEIVNSSDSSDAALEFLKNNSTDILLLDIEMPGRSGLDALPDILEASGNARILVVSSTAEHNGPAAVKALWLGACDTLAKPGSNGYSGGFSQQLIEKVVRLGRSRRRRVKPDSVQIAPEKQLTKIPDFDCIGIGASTGGIPAIYAVLKNLSPEISCPIFITQHLPAPFMAFFAKQLAGIARRPVHVAKAGMKIKDGEVYLAPGDDHLSLVRNNGEIEVGKTKDTKKNRYCPSVDIMLSSLLEIYGQRAVGVILSGMGTDGAKTALKFRKEEAKVIIQDSETSVVWGMPGAVFKQGCAAAILCPEDIARLLNKRGHAKRCAAK